MVKCLTLVYTHLHNLLVSYEQDKEHQNYTKKPVSPQKNPYLHKKTSKKRFFCSECRQNPFFKKRAKEKGVFVSLSRYIWINSRKRHTICCFVNEERKWYVHLYPQFYKYRYSSNTRPSYLHSMNYSYELHLFEGGYTMGFFGCEESGFAFILVLFILLVIIVCACEN
jgi:hypothetical protein